MTCMDRPGLGGAAVLERRTTARLRSSGQIKQELIRLYNEVNQQMYDVGVRQQRVELLGDKVVILAEHRRIPALESLDGTHRWLTRMVDAALLDRYKELLAVRVEQLLGIEVRCVLKDYDPGTQLSGTIICLSRPIEGLVDSE